MVDDKHLANALRLLASSNAYDVQSVPVINASKKNGSAVADSNGTAGEIFIAELKAAKTKTFKRPELKQFMVAKGFSINSTTYVLKKLLDDGHATKAKAKGVFEVKS